MTVGFAEIVTIGCWDCWLTVMVTLAAPVWPELLKHVRVYVWVDVGYTVCDPEVVSPPENPAPLVAVQLVAFTAFQVSIEELPWLMTVGFAEIVTIGCCCCC